MCRSLWFLRHKSSLFLHGNNIFFKRGCCYCSITSSCYDLPEILDTDISCRIDSISTCFLILICDNISLFCQFNHPPDQRACRLISGKYEHSEGIIFRCKGCLFSSPFIAISDTQKTVISRNLHNLCLWQNCNLRMLFCCFCYSFCAGKILTSDKDCHMACILCEKYTLLCGCKAPSNNKYFFSCKKLTITCGTVCHSMSFKLSFPRKSKHSWMCTGSYKHTKAGVVS